MCFTITKGTLPHLKQSEADGYTWLGHVLAQRDHTLVGHGQLTWEQNRQRASIKTMFPSSDSWKTQRPIPRGDEIREIRPPTKNKLSLGLGAIQALTNGHRRR